MRLVDFPFNNGHEHLPNFLVNFLLACLHKHLLSERDCLLFESQVVEQPF
jgi:hypothetical protein